MKASTVVLVVVSSIALAQLESGLRSPLLSITISFKHCVVMSPKYSSPHCPHLNVAAMSPIASGIKPPSCCRAKVILRNVGYCSSGIVLFHFLRITATRRTSSDADQQMNSNATLTHAHAPHHKATPALKSVAMNSVSITAP